MKKQERKFKNIPVREARAAMHVQPNRDDIKGATKEDPENCAYARCLKRTLDCTNVFVFRSIAYVETLDERGKPVLERYSVRSYAREYLLKFDGGERVEPGGFVFHVPSRCRTLHYKVLDYYRRKNAGKPTSGPKNTGKAGGKAKTYSLRNGRGTVHFITAEEIKPRRND
jgi:hypothetical protein